MQELWKMEDENTILQQNIIWRYMGTSSGVFRILPASQVPEDIDFITRSWYNLSEIFIDSKLPVKTFFNLLGLHYIAKMSVFVFVIFGTSQTTSN